MSRLLTFKRGGIHVPEHKDTPADKIIQVQLPMRVEIAVKQHIGAPAIPIVKKGDHVNRGQMIAEASGRMSAPIHTSISGTVSDIKPVANTSGKFETSIIITASEEDHLFDETARKTAPPHRDWQELSPEEIIKMISDAGIVGLGGATFPCAMKLTPPPGMKAEVLLINAAECEPYLTCDDALMRAHAPEIIEGVNILLHAARVDRAIVGIEDNKPEAYKCLTEASKNNPRIQIQRLKTKYPQGGEKQLINAILGRTVKSGALPISEGAIVQNVATAYAVYKAVVLGIPLIEKVITVSGHANYLVPLGMRLTELPIDTPATEVLEEADVVIGGPMMGRSTPSIDAPVEKGTSGITVIENPLKFDPQPCIRCGECVNACPMGLQPYLLATQSRLGMYADAIQGGALDCIECGSCNYSCPSARPIVDFIRVAKRHR